MSRLGFSTDGLERHFATQLERSIFAATGVKMDLRKRVSNIATAIHSLRQTRLDRLELERLGLAGEC